MMSESLNIKLESREGKELETEASSNTDGFVLHNTMQKVFAKQIGSSCCGIQSCGMVLNSNHCNRNGYSLDEIVLENLPYLETKMFDFPETLTVTSLAQVETEGKGCTLDEVASILEAHRLKVRKYNISQLSCSEFREIASSALTSFNNEIIVNYFMNLVDTAYPLFGHHSPLGGYHVRTDRFLVLDVWKGTPVTWVKTEVLYNAMNTIDSDTQRTRGFVVAGRKRDDDTSATCQP